jgi:hypothetical protein
MTFLSILVLALAIVPAPAHAYIDPASGLLATQLVIGAIAGALVSVKLFWRRIIDRIRGRRPTGGAGSADGRLPSGSSSNPTAES